MARRFKVNFKRKVNIPRVVAKTAGVIVALYVGNEIINQIGEIVQNTSGPFNAGFKLIGWTVGNQVTNGTTGHYLACSGGGTQSVATTCAIAPCTSVPSGSTNCVTNVDGAGVLAVVGVVGIASIVMEFVQFNMN